MIPNRLGRVLHGCRKDTFLLAAERRFPILGFDRVPGEDKIHEIYSAIDLHPMEAHYWEESAKDGVRMLWNSQALSHKKFVYRIASLFTAAAVVTILIMGVTGIFTYEHNLPPRTTRVPTDSSSEKACSPTSNDPGNPVAPTALYKIGIETLFEQAAKSEAQTTEKPAGGL